MSLKVLSPAENHFSSPNQSPNPSPCPALTYSSSDSFSSALSSPLSSPDSTKPSDAPQASTPDISNQRKNNHSPFFSQQHSPIFISYSQNVKDSLQKTPIFGLERVQSVSPTSSPSSPSSPSPSAKSNSPPPSSTIQLENLKNEDSKSTSNLNTALITSTSASSNLNSNLITSSSSKSSSNPHTHPEPITPSPPHSTRTWSASSVIAHGKESMSSILNSLSSSSSSSSSSLSSSFSPAISLNFTKSSTSTQKNLQNENPSPSIKNHSQKSIQPSQKNSQKSYKKKILSVNPYRRKRTSVSSLSSSNTATSSTTSTFSSTSFLSSGFFSSAINSHSLRNSISSISLGIKPSQSSSFSGPNLDSTPSISLPSSSPDEHGKRKMQLKSTTQPLSKSFTTTASNASLNRQGFYNRSNTDSFVHSTSKNSGIFNSEKNSSVTNFFHIPNITTEKSGVSAPAVFSSSFLSQNDNSKENFSAGDLNVSDGENVAIKNTSPIGLGLGFSNGDKTTNSMRTNSNTSFSLSDKKSSNINEYFVSGCGSVSRAKGLHVVHSGEIYGAPSGLLRYKKTEFLVLTQTHLEKYKNRDRAATFYPNLGDSNMSSIAASPSKSKSDSIICKLENIIAVYATGPTSFQIDYCTNNSNHDSKNSFVCNSTTFLVPEENDTDLWIHHLFLFCLEKSTVCTKFKNYEYEALKNLLSNANDFFEDSQLKLFRVIQHSSQSKFNVSKNFGVSSQLLSSDSNSKYSSSSSSSSIGNYNNLAYSSSGSSSSSSFSSSIANNHFVIAIGANKLHLIGYRNSSSTSASLSSSASSTPSATPSLGSYTHALTPTLSNSSTSSNSGSPMPYIISSYGLLSLSDIFLSSSGAFFSLIFHPPFSKPTVLNLASFAAINAVKTIRQALHFLAPCYAKFPINLNMPEKLQLESQPVISFPYYKDDSLSSVEISLNLFDRSLAAFSAAYNTDVTNIQYSVSPDAQSDKKNEGVTFTLLNPKNNKDYSAAELLSVFRALRWNTAFTSLSFNCVALNSLADIVADYPDLNRTSMLHPSISLTNDLFSLPASLKSFKFGPSSNKSCNNNGNGCSNNSIKSCNGNTINNSGNNKHINHNSSKNNHKCNHNFKNSFNNRSSMLAIELCNLLLFNSSFRSLDLSHCFDARSNTSSNSSFNGLTPLNSKKSLPNLHHFGSSDSKLKSTNGNITTLVSGNNNNSSSPLYTDRRIYDMVTDVLCTLARVWENDRVNILSLKLNGLPLGSTSAEYLIDIIKRSYLVHKSSLSNFSSLNMNSNNEEPLMMKDEFVTDNTFSYEDQNNDFNYFPMEKNYSTNNNSLKDGNYENTRVLRVLDIGNCYLSKIDLENILIALRSIGGFIEELDLSGNVENFSSSFGVDYDLFENCMLSFSNIRVLKLNKFATSLSSSSTNFSLINQPSLLPNSFISCCDTLEHLELNDNNLSPDSIYCLLQYLSSPAHSHRLHSLSIQRCNIDGSILAKICKYMSAVSYDRLLIAGDNPITTAGYSDFIDVIERGEVIRQLSISKIEFQFEEQFQSLLSVLENNKIITHLDLAMFMLPDVASEETRRMIAQVLERNDVLVDLKLTGEISKLQIAGLGPQLNNVLDSLCNNKTLRVLRIEGNHIGFEGARSLANVFKNNMTLREVYLDDNSINEKGFNLIVNAVEEQFKKYKRELTKYENNENNENNESNEINETGSENNTHKNELESSVELRMNMHECGVIFLPFPKIDMERELNSLYNNSSSPVLDEYNNGFSSIINDNNNNDNNSNNYKNNNFMAGYKPTSADLKLYQEENELLNHKGQTTNQQQSTVNRVSSKRLSQSGLTSGKLSRRSSMNTIGTINESGKKHQQPYDELRRTKTLYDSTSKSWIKNQIRLEKIFNEKIILINNLYG